MMPTTVLVTAAGSTTAHNVLQALRTQSELALRLVGADTNPAQMVASAHLCDAFHQALPAADPGYLAGLLDICASEQVDVLIPIMDSEVELAATIQGKLRSLGVRSLLPSADLVAACNDKRRTYDLLRQHTVATPATWLPSELEALGQPPTWPVIIKPRRGVGSAEIYRAEDAAELAVFLRRVEDPIIQEYLPGEEYTVDVLADGAGRLLAVVPRLRIQAKAGISTKGRTLDDRQLIDETARVYRAIGLRGAANIQWRREGTQLGCLELNPRFSGGLALTIAAGANLPLMLLRLCLGEAVEPVAFHAGVTMIRSWSEQFFYE